MSYSDVLHGGGGLSSVSKVVGEWRRGWLTVMTRFIIVLGLKNKKLKTKISIFYYVFYFNQKLQFCVGYFLSPK